MHSTSVEFYEKGSASNGKYQYADIAQDIARNPEFVFQLPSKPDLVDLLLPRIESQVHLNEMKALCESNEAGLRYHALVTSILLRFGLKLTDPRTGTFELAPVPERNLYYALSFAGDVLGEKKDGDPTLQNCIAARGILMRIMESLAGAGLLHYVKCLCNIIVSIFYSGKIAQRGIVIWSQNAVKATVAAVEYAGDNPPVAAFLEGIPRNENAEPPITSMVPVGRSEPVTICKHGVLKKVRTIDGVKRIACILSGRPGDCREVQSY